MDVKFINNTEKYLAGKRRISGQGSAEFSFAWEIVECQCVKCNVPYGICKTTPVLDIRYTTQRKWTCYLIES